MKNVLYYCDVLIGGIGCIEYIGPLYYFQNSFKKHHNYEIKISFKKTANNEISDPFLYCKIPEVKSTSGTASQILGDSPSYLSI